MVRSNHLECGSFTKYTSQFKLPLILNLSKPLKNNIFRNVVDLSPSNYSISKFMDSESVLKELKKFWYYESVLGNGSCFFNAFIQSIKLYFPEFKNIQDDTLQLALENSKSELGGEYLRRFLFQNIYSIPIDTFPPNEFKKLTECLKTPYAWATDIEIQFTSLLFGINIAIFVAYGPFKNTWTIQKRNFELDHLDENERIIYIFNNSDNKDNGLHFDMLIPKYEKFSKYSKYQTQRNSKTLKKIMGDFPHNINKKYKIYQKSPKTLKKIMGGFSHSMNKKYKIDQKYPNTLKKIMGDFSHTKFTVSVLFFIIIYIF
jgi:hypothetical protein